MKFSQSLDLALHALWFMARNTSDQPVMIKDLARCMNASESYLARIMLGLTKAGILKSIRGKKGGFIFKTPPEQITIANVVTSIDNDTAEYTCSWEERNCDLFVGCALLNLFQEAKRQMLSVLSKMTIAEMVSMGDSATSGRAKWLIPTEESLTEKTETQSDAPQRIVL